MPPSTGKVLIIGLDGATFDLVRPFSEKGLLPNLSGLMATGVSGELLSTLHPTTPQAWTSFMTGCSAGKHGIFDFIELIPETNSVRFVNGSFRKVKTIWALASERGKTVGVVNVPFTFPPEKVNGFMISGFDAPGVHSRFTHPPELYQEILRDVGRYDLRGTFPIGKKKSEYRAEDVSRVIENRTEVSLHLMRSCPWDAFMVVFGSTDHVQHLFWKHMEERGQGMVSAETERYGPLIEHAYAKVDEAVGKLVAEAGENATVVIMSDHGGGRLKRVINLNNWLAAHGFLSYRKRPLRKTLIDGLKARARRLPRHYRDLVKSWFPSLKDRAESLSYFSEIDWTRTHAYSWGMYGNISINLRGREAAGIVPSKEYDQICTRIAERLLALHDPYDGTTVVEQVHRKEDLYPGPFGRIAPDLVVQMKNYAYYTQGNLKRGRGNVFENELSIEASDFEHTGTHRLHGILVMRGPKLKSNSAIEGAAIHDLAPTILYLLGLEIPEEMDGRVLTDAFRADCLRTEPPRTGKDSPLTDESLHEVASYSDEDVDDISEKLRGLGYF